MIFGFWAFLSTGIPIWTEPIDFGSETIDETLISGLLSATTFFSSSVLGSELKDIVLQGKILHQVNICKNYARIAVLLDERIPVDKIDIFLYEADKIIINKLKEQSIFDFNFLEEATTEIDINPILTSVLEGTVTQLKLFNTYLKQLYAYEDEEYEQLFYKIYSVLPILINQNFDIIVQESESRKIMFKFYYSKIHQEIHSKILDALIPFQEPSIFYKNANLNKKSVYINLENVAITHFAYNNFLFTILAQLSIDSFNYFFEITSICKNKLIESFTNK